MSYYKFFESCLKTAKETYTTLLNTPRARAGNLVDELKAIPKQIQNAFKSGNLTQEEADYFLKEFGNISFDNIAQDRAAIAQASKKKNREIL